MAGDEAEIWRDEGHLRTPTGPRQGPQCTAGQLQRQSVPETTGLIHPLMLKAVKSSLTIVMVSRRKYDGAGVNGIIFLNFFRKTVEKITSIFFRCFWKTIQFGKKRWRK